LKNKINHPCS